MSVYTVGVWRVKPGQDGAFVAAWSDMARRTADDFPGAQAVLLRDRDTPGLFISSGPWSSLKEIETWRGSATFQEGVAVIRECLESFEPHTMDPVVTVGD